jgi:lantibiotic biosynthesis protein
MSWESLLTGEQRDAALSAANTIAGELARDAGRWMPEETSDRMRIQNASLGMGRAGFAVCLGYLTLAGCDHADAARQLIADAAKTVASVVMGPAFFGGFTGIAWSLQQLARWDVARAAGGTFAALDAALARLLERDDWPYLTDLVGGLTGFLVYALSRLPSADAERAVASIVRLFEARAVAMPEGLSWFTEPSMVPEDMRHMAPDGCYNHGISRGVAGSIAALAEAVRLGIEAERARRLVEGGVAWLLASRIDAWSFPSMSGPGVESKPARLAWCYGAPGTAAMLLRAADALGRDDWRETASRIALRAAEQPVEGSGVTDAEVCHGSAGLGHIFHRLYHTLGDERFADAARRWYEHALSVRQPGEGLGGYRTDWSAGEQSGWVAESAMVYGAAGIAAALAAACSDVEPDWDAMFLLSDANLTRRG